jgi:serine/alanine adding enzyme
MAHLATEEPPKTQPSVIRAQEYRVVRLLDKFNSLQAAWDRFVTEHPRGSIFHTSAMIRAYKASKGYKPIALAGVTIDGQITALLIAVRVQTLPPPLGRISSRSIFFAEPLCGEDPASADVLARLIASHDDEVRRSVLFSEVRPLFAPGPEQVVLERCGYRYLEYLNYLVDVTQPIETLWTGLHKSAQRAIRHCQRRGLEVREVDAASAVDQLYPLLKLSYAHSGVPLADRSLFESAARELHPQGEIKFFAIFNGSVPVAMDAMLLFKKRMYLWYGGLTRSIEGSPCSLLRWQELCWGHENGYELCDSGGAGWPNIPYGVRDFKRKFGGQLVQYGRYRKVYSSWKLALAEQVYKLRRAMSSQK